jgi:DNA helicase HerA-like ATPase
MVQSAIFARADEPRETRKPVRVVVDEITSFPAGILLELLAEGRKFGASVVASTQSLAALTPDVRAGLLANAGVIVVFRVGGEDAQLLRPELGDEMGVPTLTSLAPGSAVVRVGGNRPIAVNTWA